MAKPNVVVRKLHAYDGDAVSLATGVKFEDEHLTQQSFKDDADINVIAKRWGITGEVPDMVYRPTIDEFVDIMDYRSALDAIMRADEAFAALPAEVRSRFDNDPAKFVDFTSDEKNLDEMRKMGLAVDAPKADSVDGGANAP